MEAETRMPYVDGFVLPLPKARIEDYRKLAEQASKIFLEHGALEVRECIGDDLDSGFGIPFPAQLKLQEEETVVFSWIVYESKAKRDEINAKVMKDPRMTGMGEPEDMPFDCGRMHYGGFRMLVDQVSAAKERAAVGT